MGVGVDVWATKLLENYRQRTPDSLIRLSRWLARNKPESSSSHSGPPQSSESTTLDTLLARYVEGVVTKSIEEAEQLFANPLDVNDVSDSEQYQGCRVPRKKMTEKELASLYDRERANPSGPCPGCGYAEWPCPDECPLYGKIENRGVPMSDKTVSLGLPTDDKARKRLQLWTFLMEYFPDSFLAVANVAIAGNEQHNPGEPLHWARGKSMDQMNTAFRHQWDYGRGVKKDTDGQYHLAKAIWRLSAQLQLDIEAERRQNGDK